MRKPIGAMAATVAGLLGFPGRVRAVASHPGTLARRCLSWQYLSLCRDYGAAAQSRKEEAKHLSLSARLNAVWRVRRTPEPLRALAVEEAANDAGPGDEGEEADADSSYDVSAPEDFFASLPPPANVKVKTAEYVSSAVDLKSCPKPVFPEFAVIGRSNVGKSSLINMLTGKRKLALVSKQPGKTRCINHFIINGSWYLVDLPGYGYAKVAKEQRLKWNDFTKDYFLNRDTLVTVLLLVDASIPPTKIDMECLTWMAEAQVPFILVFTKCDKKKKGLDFRANVDAFKKEMLKEWEYLPPCILTSAEQGLGKQQLLSLLAQLRDHYNRNKIA